MFKVLTGAVLASFAVTAFAANEVVWNYDPAHNPPIITGTACNSSDTFIMAAGNDMSIVFSRMGINLGDSFTPLAERHNCSVRVPVKIAKGMYLGQLTQTVIYGVTKSGGTSGELSARGTFFNVPAVQVKVDFPYGAYMDESLQSKTQVNNYVVNAPRWCTGSSSDAMKGIYAVNFGVAGQRDNTAESIVVQIDGQDTRFEANGGWYQCNIH